MTRRRRRRSTQTTPIMVAGLLLSMIIFLCFNASWQLCHPVVT
jgi:cytochrome oxidase assembly protein ShyY1